jgi:hypothetical protein
MEGGIVLAIEGALASTGIAVLVLGESEGDSAPILHAY